MRRDTNAKVLRDEPILPIHKRGRRHWALVTFLGFLIGAPMVSASRVPPRAEAVRAWEEFQGRHGTGWSIRWNPATGYARMLVGANLPAERAPRSLSAFREIARVHLVTNLGLFGVQGNQLADGSAHLLKLPNPKVAVVFPQVFQGVPVWGSSVNLLFLTDGSLTAIDSQTVPIEADFATRPDIPSTTATQVAEADFFDRFGVEPEEVSEAELVIYPWDPPAGPRIPRLAWRLEATSPDARSADGLPVNWRYFIAADAQPPDILHGSNLARAGTIEGTIQGWASPGLLPDTGSNPEATVALPNLDVTAQGVGTTATDTLGHFSFPNVFTPTTVDAALYGAWCRVDNSRGANAAVSGVFSPGVPQTLTFNSTKGEFTTAEVNAFRWVNVVHDYVKGIDPSVTWPDFRMWVKVNSDDTDYALNAPACNAYFRGGYIDFLRAGSYLGKTCTNMAFSTVVAHEYGHVLNVKATLATLQRGFDEGAADVWAMYVTDQPVIGQDYSGPGTMFRTGENTRAFCGDQNLDCYGEPHDDGEPLMGALWKVRSHLGSFDPTGGAATADSLLIGWFETYNQTEIKSIIETQWLSLDDDDGDLGNGTPDFAPIDAGFREQSFPGTEGLASCYTDGAHSGVELGTVSLPFTTVAGCVGPVLPGGDIVIAGGTYPEAITIDKSVTLRVNSPGQLVRIGN